MTKLRDDTGSVLVFITLMIVILLIMVGMGLDTGALTFNRSLGQRGVDMAALAGAAGLAKGDPNAISGNIQQLMIDQNINDYFDRSGNVIDPTVNGKNVTLMKYDFGSKTIIGKAANIDEANGVRVALETANPYTGQTSNTGVTTPAFLTPLLNLLGAEAASANKVNVSAVAVIHAQPGLPIALNGCDPAWANTNKEIPWNQAPSGGSNPNNSGWTTYLDGSVSSPDVIALIRKIAACQGTGVVGIGTNICLNNGQQNPDLRELEILIGTNTDGTPKCYLTPVVPSTTNFTGCENPIEAYAQICPLAVCGPGVNGTVNQHLCTQPNSFGKYLFASVKSCNVSNPNAPAVSSCYSLRLVREPQVGM
jgi:Flp pilus assembly protein TadG